MIFRCIIIVVLSFASRVAWTQNVWEPASGPDGPQYTYAVAVNSLHYIFAATSKGIYRSTDSGVNWSEVNSGLTNQDVRTIAIDPQDRIFAGTHLGGIFISTDKGDSWIASSVGLTIGIVDFLAISPSDDIYAGSSSGSVFRFDRYGFGLGKYQSGYIRYVCACR